MDIGNFLELQGTFHGNRIIQSSSDEKDILRMGKFVGQPLNPLFFIEDPLNFFRKLQELLDIVICFLSADAFPHLAEKNADEINRRQLSAVGLGRCHGNLRSGPGVKDAVRLSRN